MHDLQVIKKLNRDAVVDQVSDQIAGDIPLIRFVANRIEEGDTWTEAINKWRSNQFDRLLGL